MDCRLKGRIKDLVEGLAREHQRELEAAGTLVELEELTRQIGDEVARQLCENALGARASQASELEQAECPDCGEPCPRGQPEPVVLEGLRGEMAYHQPSYFCRRCRRSFFPDGRFAGAGGAEHGHAESLAEDGLGGEQPGQLCDGRRGDA